MIYPAIFRFSELMELMSLVESFANDFEPAVRHHLVWQLPLLAEVLLQHGKKGYDLILSMILPTISAFFEETKQEVSLVYQIPICSNLVF